MMALEQDTNPTVTMSPSNINYSVHAEPSGSANSAVSPSMEDSRPDPQQAIRAQISILHGSLRPVTLKFEDVTYSIKLSSADSSISNWFSSSQPTLTRTVLNGITGIVRPGEILAMLGPSGSGKTTLLTALGGRLPGKFSGSITYNGHPFSSSMKRKTGFVTQDDVLYPHLTVIETLTYAALLRLPSSLSRESKIEQAEMIITELGLSRCQNGVVGGGPLFRGISGGERKRVSIGLEMLVNPSLLLLDEPTSGLDSTTAQRMVETLRRVARGGRTVVTTIHQPSSRLYRLFDKLVVLCDGWPIYSGSAGRAMEYFGSIGYVPAFNFVSPADFLLDLASGITSDSKQEDHHELHGRSEQHDDSNSTKQSIISSYRKNLYPVLKAEIQKNYQGQIHALKTSLTNNESRWMTTWWEQFQVLLKRGLKERRYESYSGLRIFQVISVSVLSGLLWWHSDTERIQDQVGLLFFFSIFWGFFPLFNAIFAFPQERPMLTRERASSMYRLSSYYFARTAGDLPMELILPTAFVTITYWMGGLKPCPLTFLLTLLVILYNVLVAQGLGLALGAILKDAKQATTLASVTMLVFLLASGYYIQHIPAFIAWLKYFSFSHYCYKLLIRVQYTGNEYYECGVKMKCRVSDFSGIKFLGIDNLGYDVAALTIMLVGYRLLAYAALRINH